MRTIKLTENKLRRIIRSVISEAGQMREVGRLSTGSDYSPSSEELDDGASLLDGGVDHNGDDVSIQQFADSLPMSSSEKQRMIDDWYSTQEMAAPRGGVSLDLSVSKSNGRYTWDIQETF